MVYVGRLVVTVETPIYRNTLPQARFSFGHVESIASTLSTMSDLLNDDRNRTVDNSFSSDVSVYSVSTLPFL
jgi:hypothetical protein